MTTRRPARPRREHRRFEARHLHEEAGDADERLLHEPSRHEHAQEKFVRDFVAAWTKVMNLDRYDTI